MKRSAVMALVAFEVEEMLERIDKLEAVLHEGDLGATEAHDALLCLEGARRELARTLKML